MSLQNATLDKSSGSTVLLKGDLYYSPNSSRLVSLPIQHPSIGTEHTIFHVECADANDFTEPYFWTEAFGWLSFVPRNPSYTGPLLDRLSKSTNLLQSRPENYQYMYYLDPQIKESWLRLDGWLCYSTSALAQEFNLAAVRPFSPWSLDYDKEQKTHQRALAKIHSSRGWFKIWLGLLSYLVAQAQSKGLSRQGLTWENELLRHGFTDNIVDAIRSSTVCDFTKNVERAGVFLDIINPKPGQPSVYWFCSHGIPVWYRWASGERALSSISHLAPLPHQLQDISSSLRNLSKETRTLVPPSTAETSKTSPASSSPPEYEIFFAKCRKRNAELLRNENAKDKQARLNRERKPPTVSAKVFEWEESDTGSNIWVRRQVLKSERGETLSRYSAAQKRYDSFLNEWDCCEPLGPDLSDDEDEDFSFISYEFEEPTSYQRQAPYDDTSLPRTLTPPPQAAHVTDSERVDVPQIHPLQHQSPPVPCFQGSSTSPHSSSVSSSAPIDPNVTNWELLQQEIFELLSLQYGFTPPLPLPPSSDCLESEADCKRLVRMLGLSWHECKDFIGKVPHAFIAKSFFDSVVAGRPPGDDECDFNFQSRVSISLSERFKHLRIVESFDTKPRLLYMFDFEQTDVQWKLAMTTAADALLVCRLDAAFGTLEIAHYLVRNGIPFRTLLPSECVPGPGREPLPPCVLPMRLSDHTFGVEDYNAYARHRDALLNQPRARVALMRGGFVWRLSINIVSISSVLQGPTSWSRMPGTMIMVRDAQTGKIFIDDDLTETEFGLITGTYICSTGFGSQTALRSWFPSLTTFDVSGENYNRWNGQREDGFASRLLEIMDATRAANSRGPLTASKWRDLMRGTKEQRVLKDKIESWSATFIGEDSRKKNESSSASK
ncbi:hypothetical protein H0H93_008472 [Arthromyces matolae]|nr:hypothetical protein H0H93_008472 [Arthromyces matolae]